MKENKGGGGGIEDRKVDHGAGVGAWNEAIRKAGERAIFPEEPRSERRRRIEEAGLPRQKALGVEAGAFLKDPERYLQEVGSKYFFIFLQPFVPGRTPIREKALTKEEAIEFVRKNIPKDEERQWEVNIGENYPNAYGGNITVYPDGSVRADFHPGNQGALSAGTVIPLCSVSKEAHEQVFRYSFRDESGREKSGSEELRKLFYQTIREIPHDDGEYRPGYYEVQLVRKTDNGPIEPMFIDFDPNPALLEKGKPPDPGANRSGD